MTNELVRKSREAALTAIQTYNNPLIHFKAETYIVLMVIAWTYLLHAYYRKNRVEYRLSHMKGARRIFDRTPSTAYKYWGLESCLNCNASPVDHDTANNLRFLILLRHEIEHQMSTSIDRYIEARLQACCLNYSHYIKALFGGGQTIDIAQPYSLQLSSLTREQESELASREELPKHIRTFIDGFDGHLSEDEFNNPRYAYRVYFAARSANHPGQADEVIGFVKAGSPEAAGVDPKYTVTKETEKTKYRAGDIVRMMRSKGFPWFNMHAHTMLWKEKDAKSPTKNFGVNVATTWYWYERWASEVEAYCLSRARA